MSQRKRASLLDLIVRISYKRIEGVTLSSGLVRDEYLDMKLLTMDPRNWSPIREGVGNSYPQGVEAVGGMTMGADPIAYAIAAERLPVFSIRPEPKGRGTEKNRCVVGPVVPGNQVLVVDDVITTGSSSITAVNLAREYGLVVLGVLALVDREEGGVGRITKATGASVHAVFSLREVRDHYLQGQR